MSREPLPSELFFESQVKPIPETVAREEAKPEDFSIKLGHQLSKDQRIAASALLTQTDKETEDATLAVVLRKGHPIGAITFLGNEICEVAVHKDKRHPNAFAKVFQRQLSTELFSHALAKIKGNRITVGEVSQMGGRLLTALAGKKKPLIKLGENKVILQAGARDLFKPKLTITR